jgi:hypothetical protein
LVAFYVHEHNHVLPHSAFRGQTPDEMYFGIGDTVPADRRSRMHAGNDIHENPRIRGRGVSPLITRARW